MKTDIEPLRRWFGFSRRERRSSFILLILIVLTILIRFLVPRAGIVVEDFTASALPAFNQAEVSYGTNGAPAAYINTSRNTSKMISQKKYISSERDTAGKVAARSFQTKREIIELNSADTSLLESLPGIGPVLSVRAIKYRELLGGFCSVNQLREVYGLSEETFILIEKRIRVDTLKIRKIDVNNADYGQLLRHPYLEKYDVTTILKYRELKGRITGFSDITESKLLPIDKASRMRPYLKFE
jgi:competence protein ComEA